jgi:murein DD-endopeptidase MepM/ murein hydrolase activator NlpD
MIADILRWGGIAPLDKPFVLRCSDWAAYVIRHRGGALAVGAAALGFAYLGIGYARYSGLATSEQAAAIRAENANAALQEELGHMRDRLGAIEEQVAALTSAAQAGQPQRPGTEAAAVPKPEQRAQLSRVLDQAQRELHLTAAQRTALLARLDKAESDLAQQQSQQLQAERDQAVAARDALKGQLDQLRQQQAPQPKSSMLAVPPPPASAAAPATPPPPAVATIATPPAAPAVTALAAPPPASAAAAVAAPQAAAAAAAVPRRASEVAVPRGLRNEFGEVERVLASAGMNVAHLFGQIGVSRGEGGPFVPARPGQTLPATLPPEKLAALRALMRTLPISAPLKSFKVGSPFGEREDPINGREAFHSGLDLDAPYMSPVYATAPGTVTYAGYRGEYGKMVEIDHGHGISTRYAHLHRYTVSVGQHVAAHAEIGLLGTTGRSTGPHVHYEVLVNGEPQNPVKFLQLGHVVPVAQQR